MAERMHPKDLRAIVAAIIYGQGLQLIGGAQWQNVNDHRQTVADAGALIAQAEALTAQGEPQEWPQAALERIEWWTARCAYHENRADAAESELAQLRPMLAHSDEENDRLKAENLMLNSSRGDWKGRAEASDSSLVNAKRLLKDSMDLIEANALEYEILRKRIAPIVAHFGVTEWGSHAFVLEDVPAQIQALKDRAETAEARLAAIEAARKGESPMPKWPSDGCCRSHPHEPEPGVCDGSVWRSIEKHRRYTTYLEAWGRMGWDAAAAMRVDLVKVKEMLADADVRLAEARHDDDRNQLPGLVKELLDNLDIPERNCSCHLSPPCRDCVEFGALREIVSTIRAHIEPKP